MVVKDLSLNYPINNVKIIEALMLFAGFVGDYVGSPYEGMDLKGHNLPFDTPMSTITDDTILSIATMKAILSYPSDPPFAHFYQAFGSDYPDYRYGNSMTNWVNQPDIHPESLGNGAAMRVWPVALVAGSLEEAILMATKSASCTHIGDAVKAAEAVAVAVYMAKNGSSKDEIRQKIVNEYFQLNFNIQDLYKEYKFSALASESVPQAIFLALESNSIEECLRNGILIGGDTDTILCIACSIIEHLHPKVNKSTQKLFDKVDLKIRTADSILKSTVEEFTRKFGPKILH